MRELDDELLEEELEEIALEEKYEDWYCHLCKDVHDPNFNCSRAYFKSLDRNKIAIEEAIKMVSEKFNLK